jgi:hypothetical protein
MWGREVSYSKLEQLVDALEVFLHICSRSQYYLATVYVTAINVLSDGGQVRSVTFRSQVFLKLLL